MNLKEAPEEFQKKFDEMLKRVIKKYREIRKQELLSIYGTTEVYDDSILSPNPEKDAEIQEELAKLKKQYGLE